MLEPIMLQVVQSRIPSRRNPQLARLMALNGLTAENMKRALEWLVNRCDVLPLPGLHLGGAGNQTTQGDQL